MSFLDRPRVILIAAASLDGKITSANREPVRFPSSRDRAHLFARRDAVGAIIVGAGTLRAEDPPLLPNPERRDRRRSLGLSPDPLRVLVSQSLGIDPTAKAMRRHDGSPVLIWTSEARPDDTTAWKAQRLQLESAGAEVLSFGSGELSLSLALKDLYQRGVRSALLEGGGLLNAAFLAADLIDEIWLTLCPILIGGGGAPTLADGPGRPMTEAHDFALIDLQQDGDEVFLHYNRKSRNS